MAPAIRDSHPRRPAPSRRVLVELLESFFQFIILFVLVSALVGRFEVRQSSMEPTFVEGQRVFVNQFGGMLPMQLANSVQAANASESTLLGLQRGQIVVFYKTPEHREEELLIKRLVGMPGDTLEIRDGRVWLNGSLLDEPYIHQKTTTCATYCLLTLADNEYFFMGDNRPVSHDSRDFGPIPADQIIGHVVLRFWPLNELTYFP